MYLYNSSSVTASARYRGVAASLAVVAQVYDLFMGEPRGLYACMYECRRSLGTISPHFFRGFGAYHVLLCPEMKDRYDFHFITAIVFTFPDRVGWIYMQRTYGMIRVHVRITHTEHYVLPHTYPRTAKTLLVQEYYRHCSCRLLLL